MSAPPIGAPPTWILACVTLSGTLAMHLLAPALPDVAQSFDASADTAALVITLYVAGLALGQLVCGPFADAFGRRFALLVGLAVYTGAGAVAALATRIDVLMTARLLQATGGCAGLLITRAIVRDTCESEEAVARLAVLAAMGLLGPGLAPLAGGLLADLWGWRALLMLLTAVGVLALFLTWWWIPETCAPTGQMSAASIMKDYGALASSSVFRGYTVAGGIATTSFYAFIAAAPFIYSVQLRRPLAEAGFFVTLVMIGTGVGNALANRIAGRMAGGTIVLLANGVGAIGALCIVLMAATDHLNVIGVTASMFLFCVGGGGCSPVTIVKALSVDRLRVGSASGLYGATQMAAGAVCTVVATMGSNPALTMGLVLLVGAAAAQLLFWRASRAERGPER